jgi:hypothetical protein
MEEDYSILPLVEIHSIMEERKIKKSKSKKQCIRALEDDDKGLLVVPDITVHIGMYLPIIEKSDQMLLDKSRFLYIVPPYVFRSNIFPCLDDDELLMLSYVCKEFYIIVTPYRTMKQKILYTRTICDEEANRRRKSVNPQYVSPSDEHFTTIFEGITPKAIAYIKRFEPFWGNTIFYYLLKYLETYGTMNTYFNYIQGDREKRLRVQEEDLERRKTNLKVLSDELAKRGYRHSIIIKRTGNFRSWPYHKVYDTRLGQWFKNGTLFGKTENLVQQAIREGNPRRIRALNYDTIIPALVSSKWFYIADYDPNVKLVDKNKPIIQKKKNLKKTKTTRNKQRDNPY